VRCAAERQRRFHPRTTAAEMRLTINELLPTNAIEVARFLAWMVGQAHSSQMNERDRRTSLGVAKGDGTKTLRISNTADPLCSPDSRNSHSCAFAPTGHASPP
jgi:hypothetical protein